MDEDLRRLLGELASLACNGRNHPAESGSARTRALVRRVRLAARGRLPPGSPIRAGMDSEDLSQEALLDIVRAARDFRGETWAEFFAFANAIVHQRAADAARRARVRAREWRTNDDITKLEPRCERSPTPSTEFARREDIARMRRKIEELPEIYRDAIALRLSGLENDQIAERLGTTPAATRQRLSRAIRMIKESW